MTTHAMVTFRLHRSGVILVAILAVVFAMLIFVAGYFTAVLRRAPEAPRRAAIVKAAAPAKVAAQAPAIPTVTIRAGAFNTEDEAKALVQRLAPSKLPAQIAPLTMDNGSILNMVLIGNYANRDEAARVAAELSEEYSLDTAVIPVPESQ
ncbi:MAG TPA: SPOR domain-containing protein [Thermoanaerobaculia bacterium]